MTRSTAQIMEWRDAIQVAQIEDYATGYYAALEQKRPTHRTSSHYEAGYDAGLKALLVKAKTSQTPLAT